MYTALAFLTWCWYAVGSEECGGHLTSERGVIRTPGFPRPFRVPISCRWIIDASQQPRPSSIVVYLTQLFVSTGISFTEYAYYEEDSTFQLEPKTLVTVTEENAPFLTTVSTNRSFLVIDFSLESLEGNHLRALDGLLDVYGINITYNMHVGTGKIPDYSCTAVKCSLLGHCYAAVDFSTFWCSCFPGFTGPNCREGPLCQPDVNVCSNNSTCRQLGAYDAVCDCLPGYTGLQCHRHLPPADCKDETKCTKQCKYDGTKENLCSCEKFGTTAPQDMSHYECTIRLVNVTNVGDSNRPIEHRLQKQMAKYLKSANLPKLDEAKVLNITAGGEVKFHFFGSKDSGARVRELLMQLVEKAKLGNFTLNPTQFSFNQEPTLLLQDLVLNRKDSRVRVGENFELTCTAQGSSKIQFRWFKDGLPINDSIAIRNLTVSTVPEDTSERRKSFLKIENAHPLDEGDFTCQVFDWGFQQCKSVRLSVIQPLQVKVSPMSSTVQKGSNLTLRCFTTNKPGKRKLGYNWTKNKALFPMVPGKVSWEDLYPDGSILKLQNIQKGGVYTCQAVDGVWSGEASGRLDVLDSVLVGSRCPAEGPWSPASPGLQAQAQCPRGYTGTATRICVLIEPGKGRWQVPDYSKCVSHHTMTITNNFIRLTLGYEGTTVRGTVFEIASWLGGRTRVHPGEAEPLVSLLSTVLAYLNRTGNMSELVKTTPNFITAVSSLLLRNSSIINHQTVEKLEEVVKLWCVAWARHSGGTFNHLSDGGVVVNTYKINPMQKEISINLPRPGFSYPDWLRTKIEIRVENKGRENDTLLALVIFRDLAQFYPKHFSQKLADGRDLEFGVFGPVVSVMSTGGLILSSTFTMPESSTICGLTVSGQDWDLDHCNSSLSSDFETVCLCPGQGLFAMLDPQLQTPFKRAELKWRPSLNVMVGCACCLVQSLLTILLLSFRLWRHNSCLLFLKLQCSTSIAATMSIFVYTSKQTVPQSYYMYISLGLQFFILIALSSQLAKLIMIYSEVVRIPAVKYLKQTVIIILSGLCGVCVLSCIVVYDYTRDKGWWWLKPGTTMFYITTSYASVLIALYIFIVTDLFCKFKQLVNAETKGGKNVIIRRVGLVKRSAIVLTSIVVMSASSIIYTNNPSPTNQSVFSISSGAMGFTIFTCYIVVSENSPRNLNLLKRLQLLGTEEIYSSTSDNSFFTKEEPEAECEAAPPDVMPKKQHEEILLKPIVSPKTPRKSVSFHSDLVTGCAMIEDAGDSPEAAKGGHLVRASYYQNPPTDPAQGCLQEIVTTRVCLELGLLQDKVTPTVMVCNVDIEPSTRLVSVPEGYDDNNKDVLHRISNDLDYLLNATDEVQEDETQTSL